MKIKEPDWGEPLIIIGILLMGAFFCFVDSDSRGKFDPQPGSSRYEQRNHTWPHTD